MNTDYILRRVVPALRSGKYEQTRSVLRDQYGFCCLGVMCDLLAKDGLTNLDWFNDGNAIYFGDREVDVREVDLPEAVAQFLGFGSSEGDPVTIDGQAYNNLSSANDNGRTFAKIADALERIALAEQGDRP